MFILDINKKDLKGHNRKTIWVYFVIALLMIGVNYIYSIFGHGVSSDAMTFMFLYPLIGGTLFYYLIEGLIPWVSKFTGYRVFYNMHNSGIALLTAGSFLQGILEIAGTNSQYLELYYRVGWIFIIFGLVLLIIMVANQKRLSMD